MLTSNTPKTNKQNEKQNLSFTLKKKKRTEILSSKANLEGVYIAFPKKDRKEQVLSHYIRHIA